MKKLFVAIACVLAIPACHKENMNNQPMMKEPAKHGRMHKEQATSGMKNKPMKKMNDYGMKKKTSLKQ